MAASKPHLALLLAVVLIAATPQPSAAVRAKPPAPSTSNDPVAKPSAWCIPCFSFLPQLFCIPPMFCPPTPSAPPPPPPPSKPQPKECLPSLKGLMPCKDYLTNRTAPAPPKQGKCCDGLRSLFQNAPICLCRISENRDLDKLMSAPLDRANFLGLETICNAGLTDYESCEGPVPPLRAAPAPEAAP
ncbi:unnamed protein product [Triticum aestivum]|uniref:Bifunctional inhibitor/plant lipid transfer protein/seed storage helical domain-containing protein n=1 Tax=Triticum aestivum TaxID=4565 RepID=A0A7H4LEZ1_WHEAT|nr:non-specific lipid-transfer protein C6-like [Triticum aestivum]SPT17179.1 unnamed protein product [Triticum aestivum]